MPRSGIGYNRSAMNRHVIDRFQRAFSAALAPVPIAPGECILIALSGGADSVALTHALHRLCIGREPLGVKLMAAHLNHRLRGDEAVRDERFVRELCERLQIECVIERVGLADKLIDSSNLEERARELRYAFLNRTADRVGARYIAIAHHADDQAETVMLRLLRGSGAAGLAAMDTVGPGRIVRPLLRLRRQEIVAYLDAIGAAYVNDTSNLSPTILRNRVRHELLPRLESDYAPRLSRRLTGLAREMRSLDDYISGEGRRELDRRLRTPDRMDLAGFGDLHPALSSSVIREWLRAHFGDLRRVYRAEIERIGRFCATARPGSVMPIAGRWRLRCEYGTVVIEQATATRAASFAFELENDGATDAGATGFRFSAKLLRRCEANFDGGIVATRPGQMEALFDADQVFNGGREGGLIVRGFRQGDRIKPLGMTGTRKVHDVFIDRKLPRERRLTWPIVECRSGILWIPGMLRGRLAVVTEASHKLLHLTATAIC
jgi:tRNA(Ile)-lysidine synthase